jgi:hypothetical protein
MSNDPNEAMRRLMANAVIAQAAEDEAEDEAQALADAEAEDEAARYAAELNELLADDAADYADQNDAEPPYDDDDQYDDE